MQPGNDVEIGDHVQMRKGHPCGSDEWTVIRTGADVKIKCHGCGRIVMLDRFEFLKRRKKVIRRLDQDELLLLRAKE
ncbi:MAG: DUF951 domain-containing protein [Oscillospiraceae bacterium]|jgi:hypothetical protein|nr:DUF951 domain-containing protein [Oscillospiraceae bacterium]